MTFKKKTNFQIKICIKNAEFHADLKSVEQDLAKFTKKS
jgi:hypothetical protein